MHVQNLTNHKFVYQTEETETQQSTEMPNAMDFRCPYQTGLYHQYEKQPLNNTSHSTLPKLSIVIHNSLEHTQQEGKKYIQAYDNYSNIEVDLLDYLAKLKLNYQHYRALPTATDY